MRASAAVLLSLLLGTVPAWAVPAKLHVGDAAPRFVRPDLDGHSVDLAASRGKWVLIDFWASWCAPCIVEIPHLVALQKQLGPKGLQIIGVSMDDFPATTKQTARHAGFNYPVVMGDAKFGNLYGGVLGLPLQYLVGPDGRIRAIWSGEVAPGTVEKAVKAAL